jgi:hypothetical protein
MCAFGLSFGAGTVGRLVVDVPSGLSLTPPQESTKDYLKEIAHVLLEFVVKLKLGFILSVNLMTQNSLIRYGETGTAMNCATGKNEFMEELLTPVFKSNVLVRTVRLARTINS